MSLSDLMVGGTETIFEVLGSPGVYTPTIGSPIPGNFILRENVNVLDLQGQVTSRRNEVRIDTHVVAEAAANGQVVFDSDPATAWVLVNRSFKDENYEIWVVRK